MPPPPNSIINLIPGLEFLRRVRKTLIPNGNVGSQAVTSGIWVGSINVFDRILQIIKLIILANILSPNDFGLMGIALLALGALKQFSQLGIDTALIQNVEENVDHYLNTAWTLMIIRGVILAIVGFLLAPHIAQVFSEPRTTNLIRGISISPILLGLRNPGVMYLQKDLQFHRQFVYKLSGSFFDVIVAIGFALATRSVWALVLGKLAGDLTRTLVSYLIQGYRPKVGLNISLGRELIGYGKWILGSGMILFLIKQGDDAFVGWFLSAGALGFYQIAYRLSNAPATEVSNVLQRVLLPTYSKIQNDKRKLREGYFKMVKITTLISIPMAVGILATASVFVKAFLGTEWTPMIKAMQLLALFGLVRSVSSIDGPLLMAVGRPDIGTKAQFLHLILLAVLIYPFTESYGIFGTGIATTLAIILPVIGKSVITISYIEGKYSRYMSAIAYPSGGSIIMAGFLYVINLYLTNMSLITRFTILVVSGITIYIIYIILMDSKSGYNISPILADIKSSLNT